MLGSHAVWDVWNRKKRATKSGGLECWTSAIEADVYRTGELVSKRMDVLVSRDFRVSKGAVLTALLLSHVVTCRLRHPASKFYFMYWHLPLTQIL